MKAYFLLGRGNIYHTLLEELRPLINDTPPAHIDLQAALAHAISGESSNRYMAALRLFMLPIGVERCTNVGVSPPRLFSSSSIAHCMASNVVVDSTICVGI